jgi:MFS family permease
MTANGLPGTQATLSPETSAVPAGGPAVDRPPVPGARLALALLLGINLFNYIDRQILAANLPGIERQLLPHRETPAERAAGTIGLMASPLGHGPVLAAAALNPERAALPRKNKTNLGRLALAFMVSYMVFAPLFGWLADRMPRWRLVGIGVILWSLASGASGLAGSFGPGSPTANAVVGTFGFLLLTRCFVGIGEAAYGPVAPTVISDLFPVKVRGAVLSWFYVAIPVGGALGYTLGGALGWPHAFYWVVPPGLLLGVLCFLMPEPPAGQADLADGVIMRPVRFRDYLILLRTPSYVLNTLGMAAMCFAIGGIAHWMPDYIHDYRDQPNLERINFIFGVIVVISGLGATLLGGLTGDWLRGRFPGSYFLVSGVAMLVGFPLFLCVLYTPFPWAWVFIFVACFCLFFNTGPTNTILANVTHPALRAPAFAVNIFVIHLLGDAVSPEIIGRIADHYERDGKADMNAGFLAVSFAILLAGVLWLWGARYLARDTALAPRRLAD